MGSTWDPAENCYCGGPEEIYPHRRGSGYYCRRERAEARPSDDLIRRDRVLLDVVAERARQYAKHGDQSHLPNGTAPYLILRDLPAYQSAARADQLARWAKSRCKAASQNEGGDGSITFEHILTEEWAEAIAEKDPQRLRTELIQLIAVGVQWIEAIDLRTAESARTEGIRP